MRHLIKTDLYYTNQVSMYAASARLNDAASCLQPAGDAQGSRAVNCGTDSALERHRFGRFPHFAISRSPALRCPEHPGCGTRMRRLSLCLCASLYFYYTKTSLLYFVLNGINIYYVLYGILYYATLVVRTLAPQSYLTYLTYLLT